MTGMGRHTTLVNGHRGEDGAATSPVIAPFVIPPALSLPRGPVSDLAHDQTLTEEMTEAIRDNIDGDKVIRLLAAVVVLTVAAIAAIVSYSHIFELGRLHGQDGTAARLLPLSVDGLIAAASLVMLHAARNKLPVPRLARFMLALGVAATVAANVEFGLPFGWLSAVVSAWPAVAFVGSVEMAVRFVRDARAVAAGEADDDATDDTPRRDRWRDKWRDRRAARTRQDDTSLSPPPDPPLPPDDDADDDEKDGPPPPPPPPDPPKDRRKLPTGRDKALAIMKRNPGLSDAEVAKRARVSVRTVQRARN